MRFHKSKYALALAELVDCFLERHGCFPLDNPKWREAMSTAYTLVGQPKTEARETLLKEDEHPVLEIKIGDNVFHAAFGSADDVLKDEVWDAAIISLHEIIKSRLQK